MKAKKFFAAVILAVLIIILLLQVVVHADAAQPQLVISQFKITSSNGQFITLYNTTSQTLDMSKFQLEYFNSYDISKSTSSKLISLTGTLPAHGYFMVNDSAQLLCYQLTIDSVSLGLSSTAGMVEVLAFNQSLPGGSVLPVLQDYVGWSKTAATGAQTLPTNTNAFLQRLPVDTQSNPQIASPGVGTWQSVQPGTTNACSLVSGTNATTLVSSGLNHLLPGSEPPATIISTGESDLVSTLPISDAGLMAPVITEILPNPIGTGNDDTDEYIELYNPNTTAFDLSGFTLEAGTTALHNFTFPSGTSLSPRDFTTFFASTTGISLSNSGGQVVLLDPAGASISTTDVYGTANDGQAWALADGKWYWTTELTPGATNIIKQPVVVRTTTASAPKSPNTSVKTTKSKASVKGASIIKTAKPAVAKLPSNQLASAPTSTPIHAWTLALVAGLALLYGAYEYRADIANRVFTIRRNLKIRRANRD